MNNTLITNTSFENASGSSTIVLSRAEGIAWCSALILTSIFIVFGNLLTIVLFAVYQNLRKKSLFLVINVAFADLMLGAVSVPIYSYYVGANYQLWTENISIPLEYFFHTVDNLSMIATINSAASISVERFCAVYWPFKHRTLSARTYRISILMVWTLPILVTAIFIALNLLTLYNEAFYVWTVFTFTPSIIICGCNIGIIRKFLSGSVASQQQNRASQNKRLTKTLLFVSVLVLLSWLPLIILNFLTALDVAIPLRYLLVASILNYSSSFINPIVYALRISEFRKAIALRCLRRRATANMEYIEKRNNAAATVSSATRLRISRNDLLSQQQLACEQGVMDTRL